MTDERGEELRRAVQETRAFSDEQIVQRVRAGNTEVFEVLLRRYNQRVYRTARSVLRDDAEAEEVAQETWVRAFDHLEQFAGRSQFATWVSQIALHEAWARARRSRKGRSTSPTAAAEAPRVDGPADPEQAACDREIAGLLELAIDALPEKYRLVFVLREIEGLSTAEAAVSLRLSQVAVKTRLHRARALLRHELLARAGPSIAGSFRFLGHRCNRITEKVMTRIGPASAHLPAPPDGLGGRGEEEFLP